MKIVSLWGILATLEIGWGLNCSVFWVKKKSDQQISPGEIDIKFG